MTKRTDWKTSPPIGLTQCFSFQSERVSKVSTLLPVSAAPHSSAAPAAPAAPAGMKAVLGLLHQLATLTVSVVSLFCFLVGDVDPGLCTEKKDAPSKPPSSVSDMSAAPGVHARSRTDAQTQQLFEPSEQR